MRKTLSIIFIIFIILGIFSHPLGSLVYPYVLNFIELLPAPITKALAIMVPSEETTAWRLIITATPGLFYSACMITKSHLLPLQKHKRVLALVICVVITCAILTCIYQKYEPENAYLNGAIKTIPQNLFTLSIIFSLVLFIKGWLTEYGDNCKIWDEVREKVTRELTDLKLTDETSDAVSIAEYRKDLTVFHERDLNKIISYVENHRKASRIIAASESLEIKKHVYQDLLKKLRKQKTQLGL